MATKPSEGKFLYHITHLDNMESILEHGLLSRDALVEAGVRKFKDIADPGILQKREAWKCRLSQYVLFHFYAKNPFDCAVCKRFGAENMVLIAIDRELAKRNDFFIIPSHPLDRNEPQFYSYDEGFSKIEWDILDDSENRDYNIPEVKKACMAECVMKYTIPCEAFHFVYVYDECVKERICAMNNSEKISIQVAPYMFPR